MERIEYRYRCGHTGRTRADDPGYACAVARQARSRDCARCRAVAERTHAARENAAAGLPALTGPADVVARAELYRAAQLRSVETALQKWRQALDRTPDADGEANFARALERLERIRRHTSARWWVASRHRDPLDLVAGEDPRG